MNNGNVKGFNPTVVSNAIRGVNSAHDLIMGVLNKSVNAVFIEPMSQAWACKEAQDFFANFKKAMDDLIEKSDSTFQSVVDTMNQGGVNWANETGSGSVFNKIPFNNYPSRTDIGSIKENIDDVRGIDPNAANAALTAFTALGAGAQAALSAAIGAVSMCGFLGGEQQANITASLTRIKTDVSDTFDKYASETKAAIDETIEKYGALETKTADTFKLNSKSA